MTCEIQAKLSLLSPRSREPSPKRTPRVISARSAATAAASSHPSSPARQAVGRTTSVMLPVCKFRRKPLSLQNNLNRNTISCFPPFLWLDHKFRARLVLRASCSCQLSFSNLGETTTDTGRFYYQ